MSEEMKYERLISMLTSLHQHAVGRAVTAVNCNLVLRNWCVGAYIVEYEQGGADRAEYGESLIKRIAQDLKRRNIEGLGITALKFCRSFYRYYPQIRQLAVGEFAVAIPEISRTLSDLSILPAEGKSRTASNLSESVSPIRQTLSGELGKQLQNNMLCRTPTPLSADALLTLSWSDFTELMRIEDPWKHAFYENQCISANWSVRQLKRQIESMLYERTGLSKDKTSVIERAWTQKSLDPASISECIRDPYMLEFVGLSEKSSYVMGIPDMGIISQAVRDFN